MNTAHPEQNKNNFVGLYLRSVVQHRQRTDAWVVYKMLIDPRDMNNESKFKGWVAEDRRGFYVMEPSMPYYWFHNNNKMTEADEAHGNQIGSIDVERQVQVAAIQDNSCRQTKITYIEFPNGLKANLNFEWESGNVKGSVYVDPNGRSIPISMDIGNGASMIYLATYVYWLIAIDGTMQQTNKTPTKVDDLFLKAFKSMSST